VLSEIPTYISQNIPVPTSWQRGSHPKRCTS
jgi:hypothetical protein